MGKNKDDSGSWAKGSGKTGPTKWHGTGKGKDDIPDPWKPPKDKDRDNDRKK